MRTAGLDGLRAVAALSVLCLHVWLYGRSDPSHPSRGGFLDHAAFELRLGLVFFFVLSGYLLYYRAFAGAALRQRTGVDIGRYARRRIARIVPAYYLATVGALVLLWGGRGQAGVRLPAAVDLPLFLVFGQNYSHETFVRLNPVTWTLCLEVTFYALLPLIGIAAYRLGRGAARTQAALLAAFVLVGIGWNAAVYFGGWSDMAGKALPGYMPYFALGMLVALWAERRRAQRRDSARLTARASAALVAGGFAIVALDAVWHSVVRRPGHDAFLSTLSDIPGRRRLRARCGCGGCRWGRRRALDERTAARLGRARLLRPLPLARADARLCAPDRSDAAQLPRHARTRASLGAGRVGGQLVPSSSDR